MMATVNFRSDDFNLTNMKPWLCSFLLAATIYQGNLEKNHKLWNIGSIEGFMQEPLEC
jgi:hypothetical protein